MSRTHQEPGRSQATYTVSSLTLLQGNPSRRALATRTTTACWKYMLAATTQGRATRRATSGCTSSKTTPPGRGRHLPRVSSPIHTYLVAPWPQGRVSFSGQAKSTKTPQLLLGRSPSRGSRYQGTTTVSITSCSLSLRIQRIGNTTSRYVS